MSAYSDPRVDFAAQHPKIDRLGEKRESDVCFTPNSDRESGRLQTVMSAFTPKADMCSATRDVR